MFRKKYPNGFRIIYEKSKNVLPVSAVNVFCDVGSIHETDDIRGASHMIEHMCFKGTKNIATANEIFIEYDKIGADFNAFTTKRYTCYSFKCESKYLEKLILIISDMMLNSTFPKNEYDKEHEVVIEENIDNENDAEDQIYTYTDKLIYTGTQFEYPVDTSSYHLKKRSALPRTGVVEFYRKYYVPNNMIFSIVTDVAAETVDKYIKKSYFIKRVGLSEAPGVGLLMNELRPQHDIQYHLIKKRGVDNFLLTVGFRVCSIHSDDRWKLDVLQHLLSGTMSGRIFMKLREKKGLIYSSDIETNYFDKYGDFTIFTQTDQRLIFKGNNGIGTGLLPSFVALLNDLVKNGVDEKELKIVKGFIRGSILIEQEDINTSCEYNGTEFLMGKENIVPYRDMFKKYYENITCQDMNTVIKKYMKRELMSVCMMGEHLPSQTSVKKEFDNFVG